MPKAKVWILLLCLCVLGVTLAIAKPDRNNAKRVVPNVWVSPNVHYFGAAGCHPNCGPNQGDNDFFQELYPDFIDISNVGYICRGNGNTGDPCVFDSMTYTTDTVKKVLNVTWRNRSDEVWVQLTAPIKKANQ